MPIIKIFLKRALKELHQEISYSEVYKNKICSNPTKWESYFVLTKRKEILAIIFQCKFFCYFSSKKSKNKANFSVNVSSCLPPLWEINRQAGQDVTSLELVLSLTKN
jgi:hypothetical protein